MIHTFSFGNRQYIQGFELEIYDEIISFSQNWSNILDTDPKIKRMPNKSFSTLDTSLFVSEGDYFICWKAPYIDYPGYIKASNSFWKVVNTPKIHSATLIIENNFLPYIVYFYNTIGKNAQFQLFTGEEDWINKNKIGDLSNEKFRAGNILLYICQLLLCKINYTETNQVSFWLPNSR